MLTFRKKSETLTLSFKGQVVKGESWTHTPVHLMNNLQDILLPKVKRPRGSIYRGRIMSFIIIKQDDYYNIPFEERKGDIKGKLVNENGAGTKFKSEWCQEIKGKITEVTDNETYFTLTLQQEDKSVVIFTTKQIVLEWTDN